ncbi:ATP-binding cassette domain-containing protein [Spiroplasma endosymbiont of Labia minor]|uniref:ATP-binding cassette domain-containing protein n=1 Tax=Spiroplasma endosymbiont of Labia minor TaxID=3066305 RepID=UPI0030D0B890
MVQSNYLVRLKDISKIFSASNFVMLNLNLNIKEHEIIALIGPNGGGKTLLSNIIAGRVEKSSGTLTYNFNVDDPRMAIGVSSSDQTWPNGFYVKDVVKLYVSMYDVQDKLWLSKIETIFQVRQIVDLPCSKLSLIQRQLFSLFLSLIHKPQVLIVSEISSNWGYELRNMVADFIKNYSNSGSRCVIIVNPEMTIMRNIATRVIYLKSGKIMEDDLHEDISKNYENYEYYINALATKYEKKIKSKLDIKIEKIINDFSNNFNSFKKEVFSYENVKQLSKHAIKRLKQIMYCSLVLKEQLILFGYNPTDKSTLQTVVKFTKELIHNLNNLHLSVSRKNLILVNIDKNLNKYKKYVINNFYEGIVSKKQNKQSIISIKSYLREKRLLSKWKKILIKEQISLYHSISEAEKNEIA